MKHLLLASLLCIPFIVCAQTDIPKKANTILVSGVSFDAAVTALLDNGWEIDKNQDNLQYAKTEARDYPKYWNAKYRYSVRIKDSVAQFQVHTSSPLFREWDKAYYDTNKKGVPFPKSLFGYPFLLLDEFVKSQFAGKQISYEVKQ